MKPRTIPDESKPKDFESLLREREEWKSKYLRALADYQNLEKRNREQMSDIRQYAAGHVITRLLPVLDTLTQAVLHVKDQGLALALKEFHTALSEKGVKKIDVIGRPFDPTSMECVEVVEGEDGKVIEEVLPGYEMNGKVIRVATVKVGKQIKNDENAK